MSNVQQFALFGQPIQIGQIDFPEPAVRRSAVETSVEAASIVAPVASADRLLVLRTLAGVTDMTDHEMAALYGRLQNSLGARRKELMDAGLVEASTVLEGNTIVTVKRTITGRTTRATAWRITAAGRTYLKENTSANT